MARYGDKHKGGRPSKAEQMGLAKRLEKAFQNVTNNKTEGYGATKVIEEMFKIALDEDNPKRFEALKWVTDRYYGKEPKAIIQETTHHGDVGIKIAEILKDSYEQSQDQRDIPSTPDE